MEGEYNSTQKVKADWKGKETKKQYIPSRRGALALTLRALVEILRRVFGGDHSNLEHQVVAAGSDSGDAPPLEESLDADPVELGDAIFDDFPGDFLRISRQVVIRRESDAALVVKKQDEAAGGLVNAVTSDACREKADGKSVLD
nr:hypothetical protein GOBAR_DD29144 [Ipomoea trifida]